jgi:hypothetical protein
MLFFRYVQETFKIPPAWLTEGTVELGNKLVKQATKHLSRYFGLL